MRAFRYELLTSDRFRRFVNALASWDCFHLSGFWDCLFHACEHRYSISELRGVMERLQFRFLGFELPRGLKGRYLELFPDDPDLVSLENW